MISQRNDTGSVAVSGRVYTQIAGSAASTCFGVKGMAARSLRDGLFHLLRKESSSKGIQVVYHKSGSISIELHIIVDKGVNLAAVAASIMSEVRYKVQKNTGTKVHRVHVFIDSMM